MTLDERYHDVVKRVAGRATLVAVTKGRPVEDAQRLYELGHRDFGENRVDELVAKMAALPADARWHFIGHIQRNKVKRLAEARPHLVHSFDRVELADAWPRDVPILVQVDFTGAAGRSGVPPDEVSVVVARCREVGLDVRGLATLPPREGDARATFRALRALRDALHLREFSMGMSADFEAAIDEGATVVRVGRALFGQE